MPVFFILHNENLLFALIQDADFEPQDIPLQTTQLVSFPLLSSYYEENANQLQSQPPCVDLSLRFSL